MDEELRRQCILLFEACIAQARSGNPGGSLLISREFEATLVHLREQLLAQPTHISRVVDDSALIHMIVRASAEEAADSMGELRRWLKGATEVVVCDLTS